MSLVLAVVGVILYARHPGVETYQLNGLLILPLVCLVLYWLHGALPLRVQWIAALVIAPLGGIAYLLWPNEQWWNYGPLTVAPLVALAAEREGRNREQRGEEPEPWSGGIGDGPWGPP